MGSSPCRWRARRSRSRCCCSPWRWGAPPCRTSRSPSARARPWGRWHSRSCSSAREGRRRRRTGGRRGDAAGALLRRRGAHADGAGAAALHDARDARGAARRRGLARARGPVPDVRARADARRAVHALRSAARARDGACDPPTVMTALQVIALALVALAGTGVALTRDPLRQAAASAMFGLTLAALLAALQAPDVALSQIAVGGITIPVMVLLALAKISEHEGE